MDKVRYIDKLNADKLSDSEIDYVIRSKYPIKYEVIDPLLEIEYKNNELLDNVYLEFEEIPLTGKQIINLCNNLNINLLVKNYTEDQMKEMLVGYSDMHIRKVIYPVKIVVLITIMIIYNARINDVDIPEDIKGDVEKYFNRIKFEYIDNVYDIYDITEMVKWYICYLLENKPDLIRDLDAHCAYLMEYAYKYYSGEEIDRDLSDEVSSGLYAPLSFVMRDFSYNPYKFVCKKSNYNYIRPGSGKYVVMALAPIINYTKMVEEYLREKNKKKHHVEDLRDLTDGDILTILKNKLCIVTNNPESDIDLFPLEIQCS